MIGNTSDLAIGRIMDGIVIDHISPGNAMRIYQYLKLEKLECAVAIIKNARSNRTGRKDIIKLECPIEEIDLEALGYLDHNITINIIEKGEIKDKLKLTLPKQIKNVIKCKNPRCITSIEQELPQVFYLSDKDKEIYRCQYCDSRYK